MTTDQPSTKDSIIALISRAYRPKKAREEAERFVNLMKRSQEKLDQLQRIWAKLAADDRSELDRIIMDNLHRVDGLGATLPDTERRVLVAKTLQPFLRVQARDSGIHITAEEARAYIETWPRRSEVESCAMRS